MTRGMVCSGGGLSACWGPLQITKFSEEATPSDNIVVVGEKGRSQINRLPIRERVVSVVNDLAKAQLTWATAAHITSACPRYWIATSNTERTLSRDDCDGGGGEH